MPPSIIVPQAGDAGPPLLLTLSLSVLLGLISYTFILALFLLNILLFKQALIIFTMCLVTSSVIRRYVTLTKETVKDFERRYNVEAASPSSAYVSAFARFLLAQVQGGVRDPRSILSIFSERPILSLVCLSLFHVAASACPGHSVVVGLCTVLFMLLLPTVLLSAAGVSSPEEMKKAESSSSSSSSSASSIVLLVASLGALIVAVWFVVFVGIREGLLAALQFHSWSRSYLPPTVVQQWDSSVHLASDYLSENVVAVNSTLGNSTAWAMIEPIFTEHVNFEKLKGMLLLSEGAQQETANAQSYAFSGLPDVLQYVKDFNFTSIDSQSYINIGKSGGEFLVSSCSMLLSAVSCISGISVQLILFVSFLVFLLSFPEDPLHSLLSDMLPTRILGYSVDLINESLGGVLLLPLSLASSHSCVLTLLIYLFSGKFHLLAPLLSFLQALAPVAPAWLIPLPWVLSLLVKRSFVRAALLFFGAKVSTGQTKKEG